MSVGYSYMKTLVKELDQEIEILRNKNARIHSIVFTILAEMPDSDIRRILLEKAKMFVEGNIESYGFLEAMKEQAEDK